MRPIDALTLTNNDMQADGRTDEIPLIPYDYTDFFVRERQDSELAAQIQAQQIRDFGGMDPFLDNTLARAWYRDHPGELENDTRSNDEVSGRHLVCCFVVTVLKRYRTRTIAPRCRGRGVVHEGRSIPPGYYRRRAHHHRYHHLKHRPRDLRRPK